MIQHPPYTTCPARSSVRSDLQESRRQRLLSDALARSGVHGLRGGLLESYPDGLTCGGAKYRARRTSYEATADGCGGGD